MTGKYDDPIYDELDKDDRLGEHNFRVDKNVPGTWPDGRPYHKISGVLLTANNADCALTWSPPASPAEVKAMIERNELTPQIKGSNSMNRTIAQQCEKHYGNRTPDELVPGDVLGVTVQYEKKGSRYIKIVAVHAPTTSQQAKAANSEDTPF